MKIAFATEENKGIESMLAYMLAYHFGRCPYYVFVDVSGGEVKNTETKENPFFNSHEPGVAPKFIAKFIANEKAEIIIAGGMGPRAIEWFKNLGVKAITTRPRKIKDILQDYFDGNLQGAMPYDKHEK